VGATFTLVSPDLEPVSMRPFTIKHDFCRASYPGETILGILPPDRNMFTPGSMRVVTKLLLEGHRFLNKIHTVRGGRLKVS
jgi:hypothetical protein